nr:hypothetical protein [Tanacetum cinerariifolium]
MGACVRYKALITVDTLVDWTNHDSESDGVIAAKEFGMITDCDSKDAIKEGAAKLYNLITGANSEEANTAGNAREFALMGVNSELRLNQMLGHLSKKDLSSFTCNSSDKNEHTFRTYCNKNGSFNKKAGHLRKHASSVSKLCFVCGSGTHLIKDCDFHEKQMANQTVGVEVGLVYNRNNVNYQNQFVPQAILLRTGKVNIPPVSRQPVPTSKPKVPPVPTGKPKVTPVPTGKLKVTLVPTSKLKVSTQIPTGRPNRPFLVPTDKGYFPSASFTWWKSTARPMPHLSRPTCSYFHPYTLYVPTISYNHMKYGGDRWATPVKPLTVPTGRYVVPTGRVIVPTGRYVVPTGKVIVLTGRYIVPTGRVIVATGRLFARLSEEFGFALHRVFLYCDVMCCDDACRSRLRIMPWRGEKMGDVDIKMLMME